MSQYKAALIGLGSIAWRMGSDKVSGDSLSHAAAIEANNKVDLVCGYAPDLSEVEQFESGSGAPGYTDLQKMLSEKRPDIVSICSPTEYHQKHLSLCIENGVPMIWLEKPPAESAGQVEELETARLLAKTRSTVLVNYHRRYTDSYNRLQEHLKNETFGRLLTVDVKYSRGLEVNGSHMLDMTFFLLGETSYKVSWVEDSTAEDNPDFVLHFDSGVNVHGSGIDSDFHNIDISVTCEEGRLSILHGGMTLRVEEKREHEIFPGFNRLVDVSPEILGAGGFDQAFDKALIDLIDSFQKGEDPKSNLTTAYNAQNLLEKIQRRAID